MLTKREAGEAVRAAKARLGVTWVQLAEAVGRPAAWTTSALLGQQPMTAAQATAAGSLLELGEDVIQALQLQPTRGALETAVLPDPTIYRFYEVLQVYGPDDQGTHSRAVRRRHHERDQLPAGRPARARSRRRPGDRHAGRQVPALPVVKTAGP